MVSVAANVTIASQLSESLSVTMSAGQTIEGGTPVTSTVNEQEDVSPDGSVTSNVLVVVPNGKVEPLGSPAV